MDIFDPIGDIVGIAGDAAGLFGGKGEKSSSQSGYSTLPPNIQNAFSKLAAEGSKYIGPSGTAAYTPIPKTPYEIKALGQIEKGFTPTANTMKSDLSMMMNPYDEYVINEINRQAQGADSILNKALSSAGQFASNRAMLGANDIDLTRLNQIGQFRQSQYNRALDAILNQLTESRRKDALGLMGAGQFERELALQSSSAPITALQEIAKIFGVLPQSGGTIQQSSGYAGEGILSGVGGALSTLGKIFGNS